MKKALVILLALTMVLSCMAIVPFGASAEDEELAVGAVAEDYKPEGTAVSTAAEFAGMAADGTYYLAADITLDATYAASFTGTLDGNGKVITTSKPIFKQLEGTVKNLTMKGYVEVVEKFDNIPYTGVLAGVAALVNDVTLENIANYATITSQVSGCASLVGSVGGKHYADYAETFTTITNCANYAFINGGMLTNAATNSWSLTADNGGLICVSTALGHGDGEPGVKFVDCANYGPIGWYGRNGGIAGKTRGPAQFINCVNEGNITSRNMLAGGIVCGIALEGADCTALGLSTGNARSAATEYDTYLFEGCVNKGDVVAYGYNASAGVGGIIGDITVVSELIVKNCTNHGDVYTTCTTKGANIGGIIGVTAANCVNIYIENCVNNGNLGLEGDFVRPDSTADAGLHRVGGIAGMLQGKNDINASIIVKNNYNNGVIYGNGMAGGIIGALGNQEKGTYNVIGNGSYGDVNGDWRVGGIVGNIAGGIAWGPTFMYNIVTGDVTGDYVTMGGIAGHGQTAAGAVFKYNIIAGDIVCLTGAGHNSADYKLVANGDPVTNAVHYYFVGADGANHYFIAPQTGKVAIDGNKITFTANTAFKIEGTIDNGDSIIQKSPWNMTYLYEAENGKTYAIWPRNTVSAPVEIDVTGAVPTATAGGFPADIIEWNVADDNKTVELVTADHPMIASALVWCIYARPIGYETNVVLDGAAESFVASAFGNQWRAFEFVDNNTGWTMDDFASGKVASDLNELSGENIFRQNLNAQLFEVDVFPTTDATHAKVVNIGGVYGNQLFDVENDAGSPATGDAIVYVVVALAVSTISLAAVAVCKKIKEN